MALVGDLIWAVGAKAPQQVNGTVYTEINDRWALMGNVGWQDWSQFGEIEIGIDNTQNPVSLNNPLSFDETWHVAVGAQYRPSDRWKVNVGLAYDSGFQEGNDVSPLFPVNSASLALAPRSGASSGPRHAAPAGSLRTTLAPQVER